MKRAVSVRDGGCSIADAYGSLSFG